MAYIITGGAGLVGANMVKKLNEKGINGKQSKIGS